MKKLIHKIFGSPRVSIILRKIVENNFKKQREMIDKYFSTGLQDQVLDLGCGTGEFSELFSEANYTGIDIDPENVKFATAHHRRKFLVADGTALPFPDGYFAKVLIVGVLHHVADTDAQKILREIKRVLAPGGKVLIMEDTRSRRLAVRLMQWADQGAYIRSFGEWQNMIGGNFHISSSGVFDNGACFYSYFLA